MRQKELRLALICYGGVSLAVYMHGITKEVWKLVQASRDRQDNSAPVGGSRGCYRELLQWIEDETDTRLRVLCDIITGASAGGINGIFLAQAITTGQSLDPLTDMWLERADVEELLDADARPWSRVSKLWAEPIVWTALGRKKGAVTQTVGVEARDEVKAKLSRFVRARWFAPPFGGSIFCNLLLDALDTMAANPTGQKLLPPGQPLDLFVTVTDFVGHPERLNLHSPAQATEMEHRITISFSTRARREEGIADAASLAFAARATASFPGAFPPFTARELDAVVAARKEPWPHRTQFLARILPAQAAAGIAEDTVLIDGSVLANAPFRQAIDALKSRPARREIDRRFVYIDPRPDLDMLKSSRAAKRYEILKADMSDGLPGFFSTIFGAMSNIPREQPIRDNLIAIEGRTKRIVQMQRIIDNLRSEVEHEVESLFGRTLFLDRPTTARLSGWRNKAQQKAAKLAGFSYAAYAYLKIANIVEEICATVERSDDKARAADRQAMREQIYGELERRGLGESGDILSRAAAADVIEFFRAHDLGFRIRRLRFVGRRLAEDLDVASAADRKALEQLHKTVYECLALYIKREMADFLGESFGAAARAVITHPAALLDALATARDLSAIDSEVDARLAAEFAGLSKPLRRTMLLAYLGFPFYDIATLPLLQGEGLDEFDPVKVDRISPDDATAIRKGGVSATLKGIEFNNFGAFFSRTYRENDYLWGRLHGAERLIAIILSALPPTKQPDNSTVAAFQRNIFHAILDEEAERLTRITPLIESLRTEIGPRPGRGIKS
ncbi:MAG: patatin-like protein [Parasphingorhabdus sp.]|nr:patatin-like protein [Parasphingorhabdus sp.]